MFKYLNPKKGTGLRSHNGDTATERKTIIRTLEGAIYFWHSYWSVKFGMAMCNNTDKDTVRLKKQNEIYMRKLWQF